MTDHLELLRRVCLRVASAETSCDPEAYDANKSRLHGHCGAVSSLLQAVYGGDIITGKVQGETHYWNRFPDGVEVDLTSCQFNGDGYTPLAKGKKVKARKTENPRFVRFAELVRAKLKEAK